MFLPGLTSDHDLPTYGLLCNWDHKHIQAHITTPAEMGLTNFLPGLALNCDPPDLSLPSSFCLG
jgi:hypothetical protein